MDKLESEYTILKQFLDDPNLTQRQVSEMLGLSLGKTNYVINALIAKGYLKLTNFKRSDNKLGYLYILTPKGLTQKSTLTKDFLKRKSEEFAKLEAEIKTLRKELLE